MKAVEAIVEARKHEAEGPMSSSAVLCRERAEALARKGEERLALAQAARSLAYSLGVFHPTTKQVASAAGLVRA